MFYMEKRLISCLCATNIHTFTSPTFMYLVSRISRNKTFHEAFFNKSKIEARNHRKTSFAPRPFSNHSRGKSLTWQWICTFPPTLQRFQLRLFGIRELIMLGIFGFEDFVPVRNFHTQLPYTNISDVPFSLLFQSAGRTRIGQFSLHASGYLNHVGVSIMVIVQKNESKYIRETRLGKDGAVI